MAYYLDDSRGRIVAQDRRKRFYRKRDLDNRGGSRHDSAHRNLARCLSQSFWPNHPKSRHHRVAGNAYIELMLVLPVLVAVLLGLVTVGGLIVGNVAVGQAAEQGVQALATGQSATSVDQLVDQSLINEGFHQTPTVTQTNQGHMQEVMVSVPYPLLLTHQTATIEASRSIAMPPNNGGSSPPPPPSGSGGNSSGGSGGYVYRHFPW